MQRPIRSSRKLLMRPEGPLFCCDSEWSFQTLFLSLLTRPITQDWVPGTLPGKLETAGHSS